MTAAGSIDDYRLVRPLGRSGTAFLAHDAALDRAVVISLLPEAADARAERLAVARAFARMAHPSLGRVHRVRDGGPRPYVVAAFVRGPELESLRPPLPEANVLEIGRGLAGALEALHDAGVAHGDVCAARVVLVDDGAPCLVGFDRATAHATEAAKRADVAALLGLLDAIADHDLRDTLLSLADIERGVASAEELRRALESLARPAPAGEELSENPYRGLRAFEREHATLFFGREREVSLLLEQLRGQPWAVVAGRSGTGKSSLVRAGLAPRVASGALGERAAWDVATMVPGRSPIEALARALGPLVERDSPDDLAAELRQDPAAAARLARTRATRGVLLIVDQLEEVLTLAGADERAAFSAVLERFGALAPGVRVLFTLRGDSLDRLVELGALGQDLARTAYVLPPMSKEGLRAAIIAPARARGFELETPAMVDALVGDAQGHDEALPLLSFALAELWNARDPVRRVIPEEAWRRMGGAIAALSRHGDVVLATMRDDERREARRILIALVTARQTRARRSSEELVGAGGAAARGALEGLVRGRLVVAGETYAIADEAIARAWPRLRAWLDEASEARAAAGRLAVAAREWTRLGHGVEGLGGERLLRDLALPGALDDASEEARAFVAASRGAVTRARRRRLALALGLPLLLASLGATAWGVSYARHRADVSGAVADARAKSTKAEETARAAAAVRSQAIALFEKDELGPAEDLWKQMRALEEDADRERRDVGAALDLALALSPRDPTARALYADVTFARLEAAERLHKRGLLRELRARLDMYDDGSRAAELRAPAHVRFETDPPGAALTLARYREDPLGRLVEQDRATLPRAGRRELEPGSYLITAEAPERYPTRYPFLVRRGDETTLRIVLPRAADVPDGMIYVPAGRTLYGSGDEEETRVFLTHQPVHDVEVGAFLIARTEVTNDDYLVYLRAVPEAERRGRLPAGLTIARDGRIAWKLRDRVLLPGEPYCSGVQPCIDWSRVPVDGVSREDADLFVAWLARSGKLPGARLCTDREWERAARGADDRQYPNGNGDPGPDDACTFATYGSDALRAGPCAPGTHPASRSPFGVEDMTGSEWEWTSGLADIAMPAQAEGRSGSWSDYGMYLVIANRSTTGSTTQRLGTVGLRVCADAK